MTSENEQAAHPDGTKERPKTTGKRTRPHFTGFGEFNSGRDGPIYLAAPLTINRRSRHPYYLKVAREIYPDHELIVALHEFKDNADFRRRWPQILSRLRDEEGSLGFTAASDDSIGFGVWTEIQDAIAAGIPVGYFYPWIRDFARLEIVKFAFIEGGSKSRYVRVVFDKRDHRR